MEKADRRVHSTGSLALRVVVGGSRQLGREGGGGGRQLGREGGGGQVSREGWIEMMGIEEGRIEKIYVLKLERRIA